MSSALSGGRAHHVWRDYLFYELRFAEPIQPSRGEDYGVVLAFFKFAQAGIDVSPQGMDIEIRAARFQLRLASETRSTNLGAFGKFIHASVLF